MGENTWNRSKSGKSTVKNGTRLPVGKALCIVLAVLSAGATAWLHLSRVEDGDEAVEKSEKPVLIKAAKPSLAPKARTSEPEQQPKRVDPNARPTKVGEVVNGYVMLPSGRLHRRVGVITNSAALRARAPYAIFKHRCNNEIACYLSIKPGDVLVGSRRYTGRFKDDFIKSMETPIIVTQDDTPEQARLKHDVIEARLMLKDALDRGEDIEQIMIDTREELQHLMRVKNSVRGLFNEEVGKCETERDVDALLEASNRILADKGIAPLDLGKIARMNILRDMQERQGESLDVTTEE